MFHYFEYRVTAKGEKALSHGAHSAVKQWKQLYSESTIYMICKVRQLQQFVLIKKYF